MENFFKGIRLEDAQQIEQAARLVYELRENRAALLKPYGVTDEAELLVRIQDGSVPEHPAYDHYLSARILAETRETVRTEMASLVKPAQHS